MEELKRMISYLRETGLYNFDTSSYVEAEVISYAYYLNDIKNKFNLAIKSMFVQTMSENEVKSYNMLYGLPISTPLETSRELLMLRNCINTSYDTVDGVVHCLKSLGIEADVVITTSSITVNVRNIRCPYNSTEVNKVILKCFAEYSNVQINLLNN